jgi:glutamate/tyrosine decarboxylase-like PLP-dependent enzyme
VSAVDDLTPLLVRAAEHAADFRASLADRPVGPPVAEALEEVRTALGGPLPVGPTPAGEVLDLLAAGAAPGLLASAGPRYFGFVVGGALPAATAAEVLQAGWDQVAFSSATSPAAAVVEEVAAGWLKDLLGIPPSASVGFVTGAQEANTVGIAAGRRHVLLAQGWDVERDGLHGAPRVHVVAGAERHATIDRSLRLLGLGDGTVHEVAPDAEGAMDDEDLARVLARLPDGPTIVALQAGNVNTGACDDLRQGIARARERGAWVHVDGAFGLWAAASPRTRHLVDGLEGADSWGCDGHKWLNLPYDSGFAFCAHPRTHAEAVSYSASYLAGAGAGAMADLTLQSSRRARGFAAWAGLRELGRDGVAELVDRCCALARRFADGLSAGGARVLNDVVLNQVLVDLGTDAAATDALLAAVQDDGTCWVGGTTWRGRRLVRVSVSNHTTTEDDVDRSVARILELARGGGE